MRGQGHEMACDGHVMMMLDAGLQLSCGPTSSPYPALVSPGNHLRTYLHTRRRTRERIADFCLLYCTRRREYSVHWPGDTSSNSRTSVSSHRRDHQGIHATVATNYLVLQNQRSWRNLESTRSSRNSRHEREIRSSPWSTSQLSHAIAIGCRQARTVFASGPVSAAAANFVDNWRRTQQSWSRCSFNQPLSWRQSRSSSGCEAVVDQRSHHTDL